MLREWSDCTTDGLSQALTLTLGRPGRTHGVHLFKLAKRSASTLLLTRPKLCKLSCILRLHVSALLHGRTLKTSLLLCRATSGLRLQVLDGPSTGVSDASLPLGRSALCNLFKGLLGALNGTTLLFLGIRYAKESTKGLGDERGRNTKARADESSRQTSQCATRRASLCGTLKINGVLISTLALEHFKKPELVIGNFSHGYP